MTALHRCDSFRFRCTNRLISQTHSRSCNMQGPLHYTDAMAEATTYWSTVWTEQDPTPCGYLDAGKKECQPDSVCAELVQRIVHLKGANGIEPDRSLQTAVVSSMCWLHTAGNSGYGRFSLTLNSSRYKGLLQGLAIYVCLSQHLPCTCCFTCAASGVQHVCMMKALTVQFKSPSVQLVMLRSYVYVH